MKRALVALLVVAGCASVARATVTTFTTFSAWNTAAQEDSFTNFEIFFPADVSFASAPADLGFFTMSAVGTPPALTDLVDVAPFVNPALPAALFGNGFVSVYVQDPLAADLTFHKPETGFFADFYAAGNGSQLDMTLTFQGGGTADIFVPGTGDGQQSFGFFSTVPVTNIRFSNTSNDGFDFDNVATSSATPEPATAGMLLAGALGLLRRRGR